MTYRLAILTENPTDVEEAIFIVHGIILDKDLPPLDLTK